MERRFDALLAPPVLASLALLLANDLVLKPAYHNAATGKLSDVAGLFVFVLVFWLTVSNTGAAYMPYKNFLNIYPSERELCC